MKQKLGGAMALRLVRQTPDQMVRVVQGIKSVEINPVNKLFPHHKYVEIRQ